jgi:hypothetical protein
VQLYVEGRKKRELEEGRWKLEEVRWKLEEVRRS